ncbi:RsbW1 [Desulforapulum autotrophicum HRM2]|uniref:RsbW1 n=1 Tax=Desulforapulum autotrophicum (strain ATCC 43914 / DSM 3382 / VKM B-1955 / HRM2) TaxID=177437 RepID=C0QCG1_DESAH|nr:ATP-binding protein [Desulforapulum autotrophicum]ACN17178.1 RsbW1 [Desulforapulum autotrophicum HRM2]
MEAFTLPIRVKNHLEELPVLCRAIDTLDSEINLSRKKRCEIQLVLEEIFTNIVNHGFTDKREHDIEIILTFQKDLLTIRFEDDGKAFDPTGVPCPDTGCALEQRLVGGLGVHFVKHFIDTCSYRREKDKNIMILKKRLTDPAGIEPKRQKH